MIFTVHTPTCSIYFELDDTGVYKHRVVIDPKHHRPLLKGERKPLVVIKPEMHTYQKWGFLRWGVYVIHEGKKPVGFAFEESDAIDMVTALNTVYDHAGELIVRTDWEAMLRTASEDELRGIKRD